MQDVICLVTGANAGIGRATALALAEGGATVILGCRNPAKAEAARADLARRSTGDLSVQIVDLASMASVRAAANELAARHPRLDVLVNSAGHTFLTRETTTDGFEAMFGVNVLGPYLLTELLRPLLEAAPAARVVDLAGIYAKQGQLDVTDLGFERRGFDLWAAANTSQQGRVMLAQERARRWAPSVTANAVHPGPVLTDAQKHLPFGIRLLIHTVMRPGFRRPRGGAAPVVHLATSPEVAGVTGRFYSRYRDTGIVYEPARTAELWEACAGLTGVE